MVTWGAKKPRSVRPRPTPKAMPKWGAKKPRSVAAKVKTLTKQVKKLNKVSYTKVMTTMNATSTAAVTLPYFGYHINGSMNNWQPVFGHSASDINTVNKAYINSYKLDVRLYQDSEADRIQYTAFVVSLKDNANDATTFDPATGFLTLLDGTHYQTLGTNGRVLVNTEFFNIHSYKRFMMGGRPGDQSTPETRDLSFTIVPKQKMLVNPRGNLFLNSAFNFPKDPSQNYYLLLFNDDSAIDLVFNRINIGGLASFAIPQ